MYNMLLPSGLINYSPFSLRVLFKMAFKKPKIMHFHKIWPLKNATAILILEKCHWIASLDSLELHFSKNMQICSGIS